MSHPNPSYEPAEEVTSSEVLNRLKSEARIFRKKFLEGYGEDKIHSHCLDCVAKAYGFRDWHVLSAIAKSDPQRIFDMPALFQEVEK